MVLRKTNVAIIRLGFSSGFIPYQSHPDAEVYAIYQRTRERLDEAGDQFTVASRHASFDALNASPTVGGQGSRAAQRHLPGATQPWTRP